MTVVKDEVRRLATIERLTDIRPIPGADAIEQANVRGWTVVIKRGEYVEGDLVIYMEVDTALPMTDERYSFLALRGIRTEDGVDYHILKTARLRGVYSQGLVLRWEDFQEEIREHAVTSGVISSFDSAYEPSEGFDVTQALALGKWETPIPTGGGDIAGPFLTKFARKTDSERVQNLSSPSVWEVITSTKWDVTEKVDGMSCTVLRDEEGRLRVMGRNWEISEGDNTYWNVVNSPLYHNIFAQLSAGDVLQLEVAGPGIHGNKLKLPNVRPFIFDYSRGVMVSRREWPEVFVKWAVPLVPMTLPETSSELVEFVDGMKSLVNPQVLAEGVVFHTADGSIVAEVGNRNTFKVLSNKFLLKNGE
jgi:RNA ligase (TIGR02306 family)